VNDLFIRRSAVLSADGLYRYRLERQVGDEKKTATFIMLNPSMADAEIDDPTIRRCMGFCVRWRCGRLVVVNLFAFRAAKVRDLKAARNPVGPRNNAAIEKAANDAARGGGMIVAAWGAGGSWLGRDRQVMDRLDRIDANMTCLRRTASRAPEHPLYVPYDVTPEPFDFAELVPPI
jgi:hypothetical protein